MISPSDDCLSWKDKRITIQSLKKKGKTKQEIIAITGFERHLVKRWYDRDSPDDDTRTGRPSKVTDSVRKQIEARMKDVVGAGTRTCARGLNAQFAAMSADRSLSHMTIQRFLSRTDWGSRSYRVREKQMMSQKNADDRLKFIKMCTESGLCDPGHRGQVKRAHIVYTDESLVELNPSVNRQNMRIRTANKENVPVYQKPKHGVSVMVAGGICGMGKTPLIVMEKGVRINAAYYQQHILPVFLAFMEDKTVFPSPHKIIFMQDGAPAHSAKTTMSLLNNLIGTTFAAVWGKGVWPGSSPDFNPIEHVWSILQDSVLIEPKPKNREELIARITETYDLLQISDLQKLVEVLPSRLEEAAANNGWHTNH